MSLRPCAFALVLGTVALCASACGSEHADRCSLACQLPEGPCASADEGQCQSNCEVATEGLTVACAQCITERSGWTWRECRDGCLAYNSPGGDGSGECEPCTEADEECRDFELAKATSGSCKELCAGSGAQEDGNGDGDNGEDDETGGG
jgi:hypothetical protein